jgi:hypothetical protein
MLKKHIYFSFVTYGYEKKSNNNFNFEYEFVEISKIIQIKNINITLIGSPHTLLYQ